MPDSPNTGETAAPHKGIHRIIPFRVIILCAVTAFFSIAIVHYFAFQLRSGAVEHFSPIIDATMEIRIEIAKSHILMDHFLDGDSSVKETHVMRHLKNAQWYANALINGGSNEHNTFTPIESETARNSIRQLQDALTLLISATAKQLTRKKSEVSDKMFSDIYISTYENIETIAQNLESDIKDIIAGKMRVVKKMQLLIVIVILLITIAAIAILRRYEQQRNTDHKIIAEINRQLNLANRKLQSNLSESETRFNNIFETMTSGVAVYEAVDEGEDFIFRALNPAGASIYQISSTEVLGEKVTEVFPEIHEMGLVEAFKTVRETGKPVFFPASCHDKRHTEKWYDNRVYRLPNGEIVALFDDITEKKQMEQKDVERSTFLNSMIQSLTHPFYVIDAQTHEIKIANSAALSAENSPYSTCFGVTHGLDNPCSTEGCPCPLEEVKKRKTPVVVNHVHKAPDGSDRYMEIHAYPIFDKDNNVIQMIEYALDVTDRELMQADLRDLSNVYNLILENVPIQVCILDRSGMLKKCRGIAYKLHHINLDPLVGSCVYNRFPALEDKINSALKGTMVQYEDSGETDGKPWWYQTYLFPDKYNKENVIKISFDITENMLAKEEAQKRKEQLIHADKMTTLGALVAGIAHEINNPNMFISMGANNITLFLDAVFPVLDEYFNEHADRRVAGRSYPDARAGIKKVVDGLLDGSRRISRIVTSLKDFARPDAGKMNQSFSINDVIEDSLEILRNMIKNSTDGFSFDSGSDLPNVTGNRQQIEQVIINLLTNACQALTDPSQKITVKTGYDRRASGVRITITDEGCGIAEEALEKIAQPFYTTRQLSGGLGIGLPLTYDIIKSHKGTISYRSKIGDGTAVTVCFPTAAPTNTSQKVKVRFDE